MFERTSRRTVSANPMSFFAISNLYTINESDVRSQNTSLDRIEEEISSAHSSILTALPKWSSFKNPDRPAVPKLPKRAHVRQESQDAILEKGGFMKEATPGTAAVHRSDSINSGRRSGATTPAGTERPRHSRMMIWLVLILVTVLALAIILGAVLGTFVNPGHSSAPSPSVTQIPAGTTPTSTMVPVPKPTSHLQSVAVTGWRVPGRYGYFTVWLFWQDQGYLSRATFNSSTGNWTRVSDFAQAKPGTPLAAAALNSEYYAGQPNYSFTGFQYQSSVAYLDENNYLNEWIFPDTGPEIGQPGPLGQQKYLARDNSDIGYYWPQVLYQGISGEVRKAHFECHKKNECWHETVLRTTVAKNGTQLTTAPLRNNMSSMGLFYEEESGRYVNYKEDNGEASQIWANQAFSDLIPASSSVAAFSAARTADVGEPRLDTYLLWQDQKGVIQMSWTEDDEGWKGPITHPSFAGADNNTALACLTGLTFPGFPLQAGTELSRCYFQTGSALREVTFNGISWDVVGTVPVEF